MRALELRLGERIARHRKAAGLTQAELAEKVRVQPESLSRIERGQRGVSLSLVARISEALHVELQELFRPDFGHDAKGRALESLLWFGARLTEEEIRLVMEVGAAVLAFLRRKTVG